MLLHLLCWLITFHTPLQPEEEGSPPYIAKLVRAWEDIAAEDAEKLIIEVRWYEQRGAVPAALAAAMHEREVVASALQDTNLVGCLDKRATVVRAGSYEELICKGFAGSASYCNNMDGQQQQYEDAEMLDVFEADGTVTCKGSSGKGSGANINRSRRGGAGVARVAAAAAAVGPAAAGGSSGGRGIPGKVCCECGATQTPQWREGPQGPKTLCNACGVRYQRSQSKAKSNKRQASERARGSPMHARAPKQACPASRAAVGAGAAAAGDTGKGGADGAPAAGHGHGTRSASRGGSRHAAQQQHSAAGRQRGAAGGSAAQPASRSAQQRQPPPPLARRGGAMRAGGHGLYEVHFYEDEGSPPGLHTHILEEDDEDDEQQQALHGMPGNGRMLPLIASDSNISAQMHAAGSTAAAAGTGAAAAGGGVPGSDSTPASAAVSSSGRTAGGSSSFVPNAAAAAAGAGINGGSCPLLSQLRSLVCRASEFTRDVHGLSGLYPGPSSPRAMQQLVQQLEQLPEASRVQLQQASVAVDEQLSKAKAADAAVLAVTSVLEAKQQAAADARQDVSGAVSLLRSLLCQVSPAAAAAAGEARCSGNHKHAADCSPGACTTAGGAGCCGAVSSAVTPCTAAAAAAAAGAGGDGGCCAVGSGRLGGNSPRVLVSQGLPHPTQGFDLSTGDATRLRCCAAAGPGVCGGQGFAGDGSDADDLIRDPEEQQQQQGPGSGKGPAAAAAGVKPSDGQQQQGAAAAHVLVKLEQQQAQQAAPQRENPPPGMAVPAAAGPAVVAA
ncbi:hypothetical protein COO60DRAFT_1623835 [Scenedesmus sp. NREL 46B-D3]|nr:hypothetical protein COO60DRAFT_1623835 [Scenedesmus sp. NREL 46B-D3]